MEMITVLSRYNYIVKDVLQQPVEMIQTCQLLSLATNNIATKNTLNKYLYLRNW